MELETATTAKIKRIATIKIIANMKSFDGILC